MRFLNALGAGMLTIATAGVADTAMGHDVVRGHANGGGAVFTLTNEAEGNRVAAFSRAPDGTLSLDTYVPTGGLGSGDRLGSQGALTLTEDGRFLLAVNAGSQDVSVFELVGGAQLKLVSRTPSLGERPISVAESEHVVYVLNAGGAGAIQGFWLGRRGDLTAIPRSQQPLSSDVANAAEVRVTPRARQVIVTERATQHIDMFSLDAWGRARPVQAFASAGSTPFGFDVTHDGELIVTEAGAGALSSYDVDERRGVSLITGPVPNQQPSACWVAVTPDDRVAFVSNTASASVSSYAIDRHGRLSLREAVAADFGEGAAPIDLEVDQRGAHLYVLARGLRSIEAFAVEGANLESIGSSEELPPFSVGVAAY